MTVANNLLRHQGILVFASLAGLAIHLVLMGVKDAFDILPEFQPYRDLQLLLGDIVPGALGSAMPYMTGAVIWVFVYARLHDFLPGRTALAKAATFATMAGDGDPHFWSGGPRPLRARTGARTASISVRFWA